MEIKEYTEAVTKLISEQNENFIVEANDVQKNNGLMLNGITIRTEGCMVSPVIYTNAMYEHDLTVEEAAEKIMEIYEEHKDRMKDFDVNAIQQFDAVKDKIIARVINKNRNEIITNSCPYAQFGDLIVTFAIYVTQDPINGTASIKITNEMMNSWNANLGQLIEAAYKNTKKLLPLEVLTMSEILKQMMEHAGGLSPEMEAELAAPDHLMYVVSNTSRQFGAYFITDREALMEVASEIKEDRFFILPSSIHEMIVIPESQVEDTDALITMVKEVNATQVAPDEVLADNVYSFDAQTEELRTIDGTIIPFIA
jgi:hypothetical protein